MAIKKKKEKRMQYVDEAHLQMKTTSKRKESEQRNDNESKKTGLPSLYTFVMYLNLTIGDNNMRCE